jgi:uncharacterized protein
MIESRGHGGSRPEPTMIHPSLHIPSEALAAFCRRWSITRLELFGSALRDDFRPDSDVDFLVSFEPDVRWKLGDLDRMEDELSALVDRTVDLVSRRGIERSENWIRREAILGSAEPIYVAEPALTR